jgi:chemotaxis protein methyltransferase CheR
MPIPTPPPSVLAILRTLIEERTGLHYGVAEQSLLVDKVLMRAEDAGFESLLDYYYFLRYDPEGAAEFDRLIEGLVVGETYFFRELAPLELIVSDFVAPAVARRERPRVWSAACSTGEEPLTLAMLLAERGLLDQVELVASDISQKSLDRARSGRFGRRSLRDERPPFAAKFLTPEGDGYRVDPKLVSTIDWRKVNLSEPKELPGRERFDVVLCRNALIYFSDETAARIIEGLTGTLRPGGALFVGVSESLLRFGSSLTCEERAKTFFYRKQP